VYGDAMIFGSAEVYGDANVHGNAWVSGTAKVSEPTHIFACGPIGSRNATTTFYRVRGNKIDVLCGCFRGSIDEFEQAVVREHKGTKHKKAYLAAIKLAKMQIELEVGVDKEGE
jgi:prolyl-tRNA synthetase